MIIKGKVTKLLPTRSGTSERGIWMMQEFVLTTNGDYPVQILLTVSGEDRIRRFALQEGQQVRVEYNHTDAKEYNGRWYNGALRVRDARPSAKLADTEAATIDHTSGDAMADAVEFI